MAKKSFKERLPQLTTKAKIIVGVVIIFFVFAAAAYGITAYLQKQIADSKGYDIQQIRSDLASKNTKDRKNEAGASSYDSLKSGNTEKAADIYAQAIEVEKDPTQKVRLAVQASSQLNSFGKYSDAVDVAKKAESYSADKFLIANWLARLYEYGKEYKQALTYYELAVSLVDSPTNDTGFNKQYFDAKITYMKTLLGKE